MVKPARRRDPRSGKRRTGNLKPLPVKGYKKRKAEKAKPFSSPSDVFSESDISCCNQGGAERNKTKEDNNDIKDESSDIVQDSLPLADSIQVCYFLLSITNAWFQLILIYVTVVLTMCTFSFNLRSDDI